MKLALEADPLKSAVKTVRAVIPNREKIPILGTIRLTARADTLELAGTNLDIRIATSLDAAVETDGMWCVDAGTMAAAVGAAGPGSQIEIEVTAGAGDRGGHAVIRSGLSRARCQARDGTEWPDLDPGPDARTQKMAGAELARILGLRGFWETGNRIYLEGVFWHECGGMVTGVATNGHILALVRTGVPWPQKDAGDGGDSKEKGNGAVIVHSTACERIVSAFANAAEVEVALSDRMFTVTDGRTSLLSKLVDADYPDYGRAIPDAGEATITLQAEDLAAAARGMTAFHTGTDGSGIRLTPEDGAVTIAVRNAMIDMDASRTIAAGTSGWPDDGHVGVNGRYLAAIAEFFGDGTIALASAEGPGDLVRITRSDAHDPDVLATFAPMRI